MTKLVHWHLVFIDYIQILAPKLSVTGLVCGQGLSGHDGNLVLFIATPWPLKGKN